MKISLQVSVNGMHWSGGAGIDVPELFRECFAPMRVCDDALLAVATGDVMQKEAEIIMKTREDAADILAKELSRLIVDAMRKNDTYNGYKEELK